MATRDIGPTSKSLASSTSGEGYRAKHCVAIGIDQYVEFPRLNYAVHDAQGMATLLHDSFGFTVSTILNQEATRARIGDDITNRVATVAGPDDLVVIFFAGHGETVSLPTGGKRGFIVPVDAKPRRPADLIAVDDVVSWLDFLPSRHVLLIFDSCFSGMLTVRAPALQPGTDVFARRARLAITAGGADQTVVDGGWNNHSVFTGLLIQALRNNDAPRPDGLTTATSLFSFLEAVVPNYAKQTPALGMLPGSEGGDVVLAAHGTNVALAPISTDPPPMMGDYSVDFRSGHLTRAEVGYRGEKFEPGNGVDLPIFAEGGRQWAILIGTNPSQIVAGLEGGLISTEFLDVYDALDWFLNPDIHGALPKNQLFFLADAKATKDKVYSAMDKVAADAEAEDSVLFYFSGHATDFTDPGELQLYDSPVGSGQSSTGSEQGVVTARYLIGWLNNLRVGKAVAILDSGGYGVYRACSDLAPGRFVLSSINGISLARNGFITWYVRRALQKLGPRATLAVIHRILQQAEAAWIERGGHPQYVYSRGTLR